MSLPAASRERTAIVVVDLGFGDSGKGTVVDYLVRAERAPLVVRYNGGAQAGHNVVTVDGRHHTFCQFGAGTFVPGVRTHLTSQVVVHPSALLVEERALQDVGVRDALERLTIARDAPITTPFHQAAGRLRELAREQRHGTCGVGVGETVRDVLVHPGEAIRARDLQDAQLRRKLVRVQERLRDAVGACAARPGYEPAAHAERALLEDGDVVDRWLELIRPLCAHGGIVDEADVSAKLSRGRESVVFEGAQGVLLDEYWGFHPHTTWSTCTPANALAWLSTYGFEGRVQRLGVLRTYMTRHGEGPLPSATRQLDRVLPEPHNLVGAWQGPFRRGWPDPILWRYAIAAAGGVDGLAVTHLDRLPQIRRWLFVGGYDGLGGELYANETLTLGRHHGLDHQAALTAALAKAQPRFRELSACSSVPRYLEWLRDVLGVAVAIASEGPTAQDKSWK